MAARHVERSKHVVTAPPGLTTAQSLAVASQFGVTLAVGVGLGLLAGQWLDSQLHVAPLFTLLGVLVGLVGGVTSTLAVYRAALRNSEREWRESADAEHDQCS